MLRRWLLPILTIGFVWVLFSRFAEVEKLAQMLAKGHVSWILAALLLQSAYFIANAASYRFAFATVQVASRLRDLLPLIFAAIFANTTAPSGGATGAG